MPTIKTTASGLIITKGGFPSCSCCGCCDYEVLEIGVYVLAGPGITGYFTVRNNCGSAITVTAYTGIGSTLSWLPVEIPAGEDYNFLVFGSDDTYGSTFTLTIEGCGESDEYTYPSSDTGPPSWIPP